MSEEENKYYAAERSEEAGEDFGEATKRDILDLLLWKSPLLSLSWLVLLFFTTFLIAVYRYSLLTLVACILLVQITLTKLAIKLGPLISKDFDAEEFAFQRQAFSHDQLFRFSRGLGDLLTEMWLFQWNDTLETRNAKKVLIATSGLVVTIVLGLVPLEFVVMLLLPAVFFGIKLYDMEHERIESVRLLVVERLQSSALVQDKIMPPLNSLLDRLEPVLGRFED